MTALLLDLAHLALAWSIGLTIVYGIVESSFPPFVGMRIALASSGESGWWGETLVYCPYCIGFWIHGIAGLSVTPSWWGFARGACLWIASLLVMRVVFDGEIVRSKWSDELEAIKAMRDRSES